jgi:cation diffusion facilitator family transporter
MPEDKVHVATRRIRRVTFWSVVCNLGLFSLKIIGSLFTHSLSLIADGMHSLSDMVTDLAMILGYYFGSKRPDQKHPYGHGRIETFAAAFIAVVLIGVGGGMIYYAALDIVRPHVVVSSTLVLWIALISVIFKEILYRVTIKVAISIHSSAVYANAWHHRSDALSSVAVLLGAVAMKCGYDYGDHIAAMGVGLMIILVGGRVLGSCLDEFTESAVDRETIQRIETIIASHPAIRQWHKLRTRAVGREIFLDLHILVDPSLDITAAHDISTTLENDLHTQLSCPVNITIHMEPDVPEMRTS